MPNRWCKCKDCQTTFLSTQSFVRCPVCQSSNVEVLSTIEEDSDMDDDNDYEKNPHDYY